MPSSAYESGSVIFQDLDRERRKEIIASITDNNLVNPPNLLRIVGEVSYMLLLAEQDNQVREKCWTIWVNDMSTMFSKAGKLSLDHCATYLLALANAYRDAKHSEHVAEQTRWSAL
jgi:hypothetical protein